MEMRLRPFVVFLIILGCRPNIKSPIVNNTDPYLACFWGKGIKTMISRHPSGDIDSSTFDHAGNIILIKQRGVFNRMAYDSNHFIIRNLYQGDLMGNFLYEYRMGKAELIQTRRDINSNKWDYDSSEIGSDPEFDRLYFNREGRIFQIANEDSTEVESIRYEHDLIVERRFVSTARPDEVWRKFLYFYANRELEKMVLFENETQISHVHFKGGLPEYEKVERHVDTIFFEYCYH